jgi:hypothetical protein
VCTANLRREARYQLHVPTPTILERATDNFPFSQAGRGACRYNEDCCQDILGALPKDLVMIATSQVLTQ